MNPIKLVILDRDGTINEDRDDFVKTPEEWVPFPGALEAIARLNHAGWHTVIATNQSGLGRGTFEMVTLNAMHTKMNQMLAKQGGRIDAVFFCPHAPDQACTCRKPLPGLFEQIGERFGVDLRDVPVVGDSVRDLQAGAAVGCRPHFVRTGKGGASRRRAARRAVRAGARHRGACRPRCIRRAPGPAAARRPRLSRWSRLRLREARLTHALNAVRSGLFVLFMVVTVIPWALAVLLVSVFARGNVVYWMCVGWLRTAIWGAKVLCGVHARLHGFERLPDSPVVLLPKHQSAWETFAFPTLMPHPLCYVFKRELLYIPFFGWARAASS
jgi:D-glycero-D-manno-heptose 1,7-bisphosphate phosphatase